MYKTSGTTNRTVATILNDMRKHNYSCDVVYDIGANDGGWWKGWKGLFPESRCFQFEANPDNRPSIAGQGERFFTSVLSDEDGKEVKFYVCDSSNISNTGYSYYREMTPAYSKKKYRTVETITLDSLVENEKLPLPDFVKMDTQGSEVDIIRGAGETLKECKMILSEVPVMYYNEGAPNFGEYIAAFYEHGFIATAIQHIAVREGVLNQMDVVFLRHDVLSKLHDYKNRRIEL